MLSIFSKPKKAEFVDVPLNNQVQQNNNSSEKAKAKAEAELLKMIPNFATYSPAAKKALIISRMDSNRRIEQVVKSVAIFSRAMQEIELFSSRTLHHIA